MWENYYAGDIIRTVSSNIHKTLWGSIYCDPHFTDEETKAYTAKLLSHKLVSVGIWIHNFLFTSRFRVLDTILIFFDKFLLTICILYNLRPTFF